VIWSLGFAKFTLTLSGRLIHLAISLHTCVAAEATDTLFELANRIFVRSRPYPLALSRVRNVAGPPAFIHTGRITRQRDYRSAVHPCYALASKTANLRPLAQLPPSE
jgi:hypothetical protein